jgi:hypothetical protein
MLESTAGLLGGLCLSALPLLISFCIVGSIVAALRAVSRASATLGTKGNVLAFVRKVTVWDDLNRDMRKSQMSGGNAPWLKESARTGESCATPR